MRYRGEPNQSNEEAVVPERANAPVLFGQVGRELRKLRNAAGVNQATIAKALGISQDTISNFERGHRWPSDSQINAFLTYVRASDADRQRILDVAARGRYTDRRWWDMFAGVFHSKDMAMFGYEDVADVLIGYSADFVPALFQTSDYAQAIADFYRAEDSHTGRARFVQCRMERKVVVTRGAAKIEAIFLEGALRAQIGGAGAMREQLQVLLRYAALPQVSLRVIPYDAGVAAVAAPPFQIFAFNDETPDLLVREMSRNLDLTFDPAMVRVHRGKIEQYASCALSPQDTITLIKEVVNAHA